MYVLCTDVEHSLHQHLIDHLNAEIGLGTVTSASTAKKWLMSTFLYVRLKDNPEHYQLDGQSHGRTLDERLENICKQGISRLVESDLVRGDTHLSCTELGDSMTRYYIQFNTMKVFLSLPPKAKISELLSCVSQAAEFKDIRFRAGEKQSYKQLNKNPSMKFPIPVNIDSTAHKVSLILQSVLGAIEPSTEDMKHRFEYANNKSMIFQHVHRLIRCIIDCQLYLEDSISVRNALTLARSFGAQVWDDSPLHMKQIEGIGLVYVRKLVAAGLKSIEDLANTEPGRIERTLSRQPPFGTVTQQKAMAFPQLRISMKSMGEPVVKKGESVTIKVKAEIGFLNEKVPQMFLRKPVYVCLLADTSDGRKAHFARISAKKLGNGQEIYFSASLTAHGQTIRGYLMCDEIAGTQKFAALKPEVPAFMFPTPKLNGDSQPLPSLVNAPNTCKRRAAAGTEARIDNEVGDSKLDETSGGFANIEDFDDEGNERKPQVKTASKRKQSSVEKPESVLMPNGKWTCNHACKDKTACKHGACCREGLDKKPKPQKIKEPKKIEPSSDPRQTQLNLAKAKQAHLEPPPPRKQVGNKEAQNLDRLHNSIKTSTKSIPLLSGAGKQHSAPTQKKSNTQHDFDDDFGLDTLGSDDFPSDTSLFDTQATTQPKIGLHEVEDDMLDMPNHVYGDMDATQDHNGGLVNLSSTAGHQDTTMSNDWDFEDITDEYLGGEGGLSPLNLLADHSDENKNTSVLEENEDNFDSDLALVSGALQNTTSYTYEAPPKRTFADSAPDDASQFFSTPKQQKMQSRTPTGLERGSELRANEPIPLQGNESLAEATGNTSTVQPTEVKQEQKEEDLKDWFERELGTELFTLTG